MRIKLDENLPAALADDLAGMGHQVDTVRSERLTGADDETILRAATRARRVLFTLDKGVGNLTRRAREPHGGVVLFRLQRQGPRSVRHAVLGALDHIEVSMGEGRLVVVTEGAIRTRR